MKCRCIQIVISVCQGRGVRSRRTHPFVRCTYPQYQHLARLGYLTHFVFSNTSGFSNEFVFFQQTSLTRARFTGHVAKAYRTIPSTISVHLLAAACKWTNYTSFVIRTLFFENVKTRSSEVRMVGIWHSVCGVGCRLKSLKPFSCVEVVRPVSV